MGKKILFSPIGGTDPITKEHDGSMLHIVRHYNPDKIYLFLSKEMSECEMQDHRYTKALELLGEHQGRIYDYEVIDRPDLVDVQDYNVFYDIFGKILKEIQDQMVKDDILLVNIASGTPAMKSALGVLAALAEYSFIPIQVSTPIKAINKNIKTYDLIEQWKNNKDNDDNTDNRCVAKKVTNLLELLKKDMIKKHIQVYDYVAALQIANDMKNQINPETVTFLRFANARLLLDFNTMNQWMERLPEYYKDVLFPVKNPEQRNIYEYALGLQIKLQKEEYADFVRAITPIVLDLCVMILENNTKIKISDYTSREKNGVENWDMNKLKNTPVGDVLQKEFHNKFKAGPVYSSNIVPLMRTFIKNGRLVKDAECIRNVEQKIRNIAAHEIVSITSEKIQKLTGNSPREIMQVIKNLIAYAGIDRKRKYWDSYDKMNELILKSLKNT